MSLLVLTATAFKGHLDSPPTAVWAGLLIGFGLSCGLLGWFGWRHGDRVVPSSLPETMQRQRSVVIRRGAAFFFVMGVILAAMGILTAVGG